MRKGGNSTGRKPPSSPAPSTLSASSIVEALKSIEKNPFSMNNIVPVISGRVMMDNNALRMTSTMNRSVDLIGSSNNTVDNHHHPLKSTDRKIPLDSYSRSVEYEKALLRIVPSTCTDDETTPNKKPTAVKQKSGDKSNHDNKDFLGQNEQLSGELNKQKSQTYSKMKAIELKEEELCRGTIDLVPAHMLVKHGLFHLIKGKQMDKIMNLLFKMRLQLLGQGLALWHKHAQLLSTALFGASAITVHRVARGFLARRRVKRLYKELLAREKQRSKSHAVAMMNKAFKVTMIQACMRRYLAVRVVEKERLHKKSIITIQHFYKQWRYQGRAKAAFELFLSSHFACKKIQRVWRGHRGRLRAHAQAVVKHRAGRQSRYESREGIFEIYFEQHGAAVCIQKWYNALHFVHENKQRAREAKRRKQLNRIVLKIQKMVRLYIMNKKMLRKFEARRLQVKYNLRPRQFALVIKAQARMRRFLVQRRNQVLFAEFVMKRERRRVARDLGITPHHRKTDRFEHLKIGDLRNIVRLERKAVLIQRWYKAARVLRYFHGMIRNRRQLVTDRILRWYRRWRYRQLLKMSLFTIQPMWRRAVQKFLVRKRAQITIARKYKSHRAMKWFRDWRRQKNVMAGRIQRMTRGRFRRREVREALARARFASELLCSGQQLFDKTNIFNLIDEMSRRIHRTKIPLPKFELQLLFMLYCPNAQVDVAKGSKLIKECPGLAGPPALTLKELELIFSKVKGAANGSALDYSQFLQYLFHIACVKYLSLDASLLALAGKINHNTDNKKELAKVELSLRSRQAVDSYCFGRVTGRKALITRLVYDYISKNPAYKQKEKSLENKSAVTTSTRTVDEALSSIQRMFKVIIFRMGMYRVRQAVLTKKRHEKQLAAVTVLQSYARRYLGRRRGIRLAQRMYLKYIDNDSGVPFWTNAHTGTSFWVKPPLLRELDCGDGIKLPLEREQYTPFCGECEETAAACFCEQCNSLYCNAHFGTLHTSGARKTHDCIKLEMCAECTFQAPTKRCLVCDELYCDTCFRFVHRRGRSRLHTFSWVTANCYYCDDRAAHWRRIDSWNSYQEELLCTVDFWDMFGCDPRGYEDPTGQYIVCAVAYTGPSVSAWRLLRSNAEAEKAKAEAYLRQQAELAERRRQQACLVIQRVYRGCRVRRTIKTFLGDRREFLRQRALERPVRDHWRYRLAWQQGRARALPCDTNREKVLRKYPESMHETVALLIERKWGLMAQLLEPVDLGDLAPENLLWKERLKAYLALQRANLSLTLAQKNVKSRERAHESNRERYRLARSSSTANDKKKKALQLAANKASKSVDKAKAKLTDVADSQLFARHKYEYFTGPRELQKLVTRRRKTGVPMPFTIDLVHCSRYAVVRYDKPSAEATVSDQLFHPKPGKWRSKIKTGNIVKIHGMHFTVVEDVEDLTDIQEQLEVELQAEKEAEAARLAEEERLEKERIKRERLRKSGGVSFESDGEKSVSLRLGASSRSLGGGSKAKVKSSGEASTEQETADGGGGGGEVSAGYCSELTCIVTPDDKHLNRRDRKEFEDERVPDRIKLDRPWLFADMICQDIHLVTVKPPLERSAFDASRSVQKSAWVQSACAFNVLMLHKKSKLWTDVGKIFDEESAMGVYFATQSRGAARKRDMGLKMCRAKVDLTYEYRLKERLLYVFKVAYNIPKGMIVSKYERYKLHQQFKNMSPYRRWERSEDKTEIKVVLESGVDDSEVLGFMMMDTDAPLDVARDYIQRNFRAELNETCGSAFQFFTREKDGNEELVPVAAEEDKWSINYLREKKGEGEEGAGEWVFTLSAQGGEREVIEAGNLSDEEDVLGGDGDVDFD